MSVENNGKIIKYAIPSKDLPVDNKSKFLIFTCLETEEVIDKSMKDLIDTLNPEIGRCYTNTDMLIDVFKGKGYAIDFFAGWVIVDGIPVYHAWGVCGDKNQYVIDFSIKKDEMELSSGLNKDDPNYRDEYMRRMENLTPKPLSERITFGRVVPGIIYIGCKTDSKSARELYWKIVENKESVFFKLQSKGMNPYGASEMQKKIINTDTYQ